MELSYRDPDKIVQGQNIQTKIFENKIFNV